MTTTARTSIRLPLYLEVMARMPGVEPQDIQQTKKIFEDTFGELPSRMTVSLGRGATTHLLGDVYDPYADSLEGMYIHRVWTSKGRSGPVEFALTRSYLFHSMISTAVLPAGISHYFLDGIFGVANVSATPVEGIEWGAKLAFQVYRCAEGGRDVEQCMQRPSAQRLLTRLVQAQSREMEIRELRERAARAEAVEQGVREAVQLNARVDGWWRTADQMKEDAIGLLGAGDPDDIDEILKRYAGYRAPAEDLDGARAREAAVRDMMREIGEAEGGWPQFKEKFCRRGTLSTTGRCSDRNESGSVWQRYALECDFGVTTKEVEEVSDCMEKFHSVGREWGPGDTDRKPAHHCD